MKSHKWDVHPAPQLNRLDDKLALMPGSIRRATRAVDDDF